MGQSKLLNKLNISMCTQLVDIIQNWHQDELKPPPRHYGSLCRFDFATEWHKAVAYRDAEVS